MTWGALNTTKRQPFQPHQPLQLLAQLLSGFINQLWSLFAGFMVPYPVRMGVACCKRLFWPVLVVPNFHATSQLHVQHMSRSCPRAGSG